MSSILSIVMTILVYVISHGITSIIYMAKRSQNALMEYTGNTLYVIFPNFEALNLKHFIMSSFENLGSYVAYNTLYAVLYAYIILGLTIIIFNRKTFEV